MLTVIDSGRVIVDYPGDTPYPSSLILGFIAEMPLHIVFAFDEENSVGIVITAYVPDSRLWNDDFTSRRDKK